MGRPWSGGPRGISRASVGCRRTLLRPGLGVVGVHGGVKFYRGAASAARAYVERDRSRADDYYLGEGTGIAARLIATPDGVEQAGSMTGRPMSGGSPGSTSTPAARRAGSATTRTRCGSSRSPSTGPKTWSLAAALHPEISAALDEAQDKAAAEIVGWVAGHATTRVGPTGTAGAGAGGADRGGGDPALHLPGRRSAPASSSADQRPRLGGRRVAGHPLGRDPGQHRGDQRDRARRGRDRPGVPVGARGARVHPRPGDQRDPAAGPVRGCVQRADRADPPQRRPLRSRLALRAPRRGARSKVARGVGPAGVGTSTPRQGRTRGRRRARGPLEHRAARSRLPRPDRTGAAGGDAAGVDRPRCRRRAGRLHPRGEEVGLEHRRYPREDRGPPRPNRAPRRHGPPGSSSPKTSPPGRPTGASVLARRPMCPSTSGRSARRRSSRSRPT